ncbi:hypothetical protein RB195_009780 [Necator americanus]
MPAFEQTKVAAEAFAKLICCANPECRQESDNLQTLGTTCKHAFCWDCINSYSSMNTLVLCPMCACPLEVNHPKAAIIFNNLAHHINDFRLLLDEYEKCLANEGEVTAAGTIAQTQALLKGHDFASADEVNQTARNNAVNEFISTQRLSSEDLENDLDLDSPASDFSEELNLTPPPTNPHLTADVNDGQIRANSQTVVEFAECFDRLSDEDLAVTPVEDGIITDSAPQFDQPLMSSTQRPNLFLSQALHARNEMFQKEATQEVKTYRGEKSYNYFAVKPTKTFDKGGKDTEAPWLDLLRRGRTNVPPKTTLKIEIQEGEEFVVPSTSVQDDRVTPKRGPKVEISSSSRGRKSSFSTPRPYSRIDDPVMDAVISGELDQVKSAIEAGHDVNNRDQQKRTPLFVAVEMKRLDICKVLVERGGAVINANCGPDCNTALHVAVAQGNEEIARYLLSKGASKTIRNIRQETPSQLAQPRSPLRSLVEKYRTHPRQLLVPRLPDVYIVCYAKDVKRTLTYGEQSLLNKLMTVVEFCDEATTHYVVAADADGVASVDADLLRAMLQNTRIMSVDWLKECVRLNKTVPHLHYEVSKLRYLENDVVVNSLERCRKSKERMEPGLFHGCVFYLLLKKYKGIDDRRLLPDLIRLGGGELSVGEPEYEESAPLPFHAPQLSSPIFIVYDVTMTRSIPNKFHRHPTRYNMVSAQWIIESVMEYGIKPVA